MIRIAIFLKIYLLNVDQLMINNRRASKARQRTDHSILLWDEKDFGLGRNKCEPKKEQFQFSYIEM